MSTRSLRIALAVAALLGALPAGAGPATDVVGRWRDSDGESEIAIARCGAALCGRIVWLKEPRFDQFNPDARLRARSLLGIQVLSGFTPGGDGKLVGDGYNPADGKSYRTTMELAAPGTLVVRGCVLGGLICDDDTWTKQP
ncbi:DUF2147 domain-containing protein [Bosea sp. TAF32]|uniref:DUF2147 domain-containing protein n=1 Tax=Bosea sp. TAF32 TaxID=3237482 RepID=UPI003F8DAB6A